MDEHRRLGTVKSSTKAFKFTYTIADNYFNNRYFKNLPTGFSSEIQYAHDLDGRTSNVFLFSGGACIGETDYEYTDNRMSRVLNYPNALTLPDKFTSKEELTWEDGNIISIKYTKGQDTCTQFFSYVLTEPNPLCMKFSDLLWCDPANDFSDFNEAVFLSKNLIRELTSPCSGLPPRKFTYQFNSNGQVTAVKVNGKTTWAFEYSCN